MGLSWCLRWWRICLQCGRPGFYPWVGKIPWRRKWPPTPVFLPGECHGQRSLVGCSLGSQSKTRSEQPTLSLSPGGQRLVVGSCLHPHFAFAACANLSVKGMENVENVLPVHSHFLLSSPSQEWSFWLYKLRNLIRAYFPSRKYQRSRLDCPHWSDLGWRCVCLSSVDSRCCQDSCATSCSGILHHLPFSWLALCHFSSLSTSCDPADS